MSVEIWSYKETNPHRIKRVIWAIINVFFFPLVSNRYRKFLLRIFGATLKIHVRIYRSAKIYAPWNLVLDGPHGPVCIGPRVEIYNKDKAKVTSAKVYYGTSSNPTKSVSATVSGVLITANISGLKKGTTYYIKCVATGKGGTTTTGTTKVITNY